MPPRSVHYWTTHSNSHLHPQGFQISIQLCSPCEYQDVGCESGVRKLKLVDCSSMENLASCTISFNDLHSEQHCEKRKLSQSIHLQHAKYFWKPWTSRPRSWIFSMFDACPTSTLMFALIFKHKSNNNFCNWEHWPQSNTYTYAHEPHTKARVHL